MSVTNYYLVNKETKKVHFLFKLDPYFLSKDSQPESWLAGRLYRSDPDAALTLEELYALDYSEDYWIPNLTYSGEYVFELFSEAHYASYKGYRIHRFAGQLQIFDDFAGNDFMESNAFMATLFNQHIGPDEVKKWNAGMGGFDDKYGANELIMQHFTIESDKHEGIHLHKTLRDDWDWEGFTTGR